MQPTQFIWHNGNLVAWEEARIHVLTHTLHYGGGAFEGIRAYATDQDKAAIFRLTDHIDRLFYSASVIKMEIPYTKQQVIEAVKATVQANKITQGYIRPIVFYGYGVMGVNPAGAPVELAIAIWPWDAYLCHSIVDVKTSQYIRIHPDSTVTDAKLSGHYINSILARLEIQGTNYHEALMLDAKGYITEGSGENIFIVKDQILYTPRLGNILPGITRDTVKLIAKDKGYQVVEKDLLQSDIYQADEAFFTGTAVEITPIRSLDDKTIGSGQIGPITQAIHDTFFDIVHGRNSQYEHFLTRVD